MKTFLKKNLTIVLAFGLPVVFIATVALSAYLPSLFLKTDYDYIYATCSGEPFYSPDECQAYLEQRYSVVDGKLTIHEVPDQRPLDEYSRTYPDSATYLRQRQSRLLLHDTQTNVSREISLEEAQQLTLNELLTSPDGVTFSAKYQEGTGSIFFYMSSSYNHYLTQGMSKQKQNLIEADTRSAYYNNYRFIGWVIPGRN